MRNIKKCDNCGKVDSLQALHWFKLTPGREAEAPGLVHDLCSPDCLIEHAQLLKEIHLRDADAIRHYTEAP